MHKKFNFNLKLVSIYLLTHLSRISEANQVSIESPVKPIKSEGQYEFVPISTLVGFGFIGVCFLLLTISKMMYANSDQYMANNRFDLVIFKPPTKNSVIGRVYSNNTANAHNLAAATSSGFDVSMLDVIRVRNTNTNTIVSN